MTGLTLVGLLFIAWLVWIFAAQVSVYEVSRTGRLEVERAAHPIVAEVDGRIVEVPIELGDAVDAGDVLIRLDSEELEVRRREEETRRVALTAQIEATREELRWRGELIDESRADGVLEEARARLREAELAARFAAEEASRAERLHAEGQVAKVEMERLQTEAQRLTASAESAQAAVEKEESAQRTRILRERADLADLQVALARLEGDLAGIDTALDEIEIALSRRLIRAPRDGEVGELAELNTGVMARAGEPLGTLVGSGEIRAVAELAPASALGKVRVGQAGEVRLDGFPWTQFGKLEAEVVRVATEPRGGTLRVELAVDPKSAPRIPLQHGMSGSIEIQIEKTSPALLLLRALGKLVVEQEDA